MKIKITGGRAGCSARGSADSDELLYAIELLVRVFATSARQIGAQEDVIFAACCSAAANGFAENPTATGSFVLTDLSKMGGTGNEK